MNDNRKPRQVTRIDTFADGTVPRIIASVGNIRIALLFDTGSTVSLINNSVYRGLPTAYQKLREEVNVELYDVHNRRLKTVGTVNLPIFYEGETLNQDFVVAYDIAEEGLLGMNAIRTHEFVLDGAEKCIYLKRKRQMRNPIVHIRVKTIRKVNIPPYSGVICQVVPADTTVYVRKSTEYVFEPIELAPGLVIDPSVSVLQDDGKFNVVIKNESGKNISLHRALVLGHLDMSQKIVGRVASVSQHEPLEKEDTAFYEDDELDVEPEFKPHMKEILKEYKELFAYGDNDLGCTGVIKHTIDTQGKGPIAQRPYRTPYKLQPEMNRQIQELLDKNIIRESTSPWASPAMLVAKKGGEYRLVVDYRKVNSITKPDSFPLPLISDCLDKMNKKTMFTTLDFKWGYHQILMSEESKEITAMIVSNGLYEWNRLPNGLRNAPSLFVRTMQHILRDVLGKFCLTYLDDVIIFSDNVEDHIKHIKIVFDLIKEAGFKLKLKKCQFMKRKVVYLGHVASAEGISPDQSKIEKLANYKRPTSAEEVRQFLGASGYYRKFIKDYGKIARPLNLKTHKENLKKPFTWDENDQAAFETLRTALITPPVLAYPDFTLPFVLNTDASSYAIGCVLSQVQNGKEKPIAYGSRQLNAAERNYSVTEKEALSVVYGVKQFKHYLSASSFKVINDHKGLQWLHKHKDADSRLGRWALSLSGLNYTIEYKKGVNCGNADFLSRLRVSAIREGSVEIDIKKEQDEDRLCKAIRLYLEKGELSEEDKEAMPIWAKEINLYTIHRGNLFREEPFPRRKERTLQLVLPFLLREKVLKELHDEPTSGHLAFMKTYNKVKDMYYWPTMRNEILSYCQACEVCLANSKSKLRAPLHPIDLATSPFQVLSCDFMGPITPVSPNGNKYIMVVTCYFSKWIEVIPLPDQTTETTLDALYKYVISRYGPPKILVSDRGTNLTSTLFRAVCDKLNIDKRYTTSYHQMGNGMTERVNRSLLSMLRKLLQDGSHCDWEKLLLDVAFAYRSSVHNSIKETPYFIVHGRDPNINIEQMLNIERETFSPGTDYISKMMERLRVAFKRVKEEAAKSREYQKSQYDKRARVLDYKVGDRCLLDNRIVLPGDSKKFTSFYKGPYRILKVYDNDTVDICTNSYEPMHVHKNRIKLLCNAYVWKDFPSDSYEPADENVRKPFHKDISTQTILPEQVELPNEDLVPTLSEKGLGTCAEEEEIIEDVTVHQPPAELKGFRPLEKEKQCGNLEKRVLPGNDRGERLRPRNVLNLPARYLK